MNEFLDYIKNYIKTKFASDTTMPRVTVENAYKAWNEVSTKTNLPQIVVQIMDNSEVARYSSFENENVSAIPLQITSYTQQIKIGGSMKSAQEASLIFGQKIKDIFSKVKVASDNENVLMVMRTSMSPALPLNDGKVYMTAIRFNIWVANPYVVRVEPQNNEQGE